MRQREQAPAPGRATPDATGPEGAPVPGRGPLQIQALQPDAVTGTTAVYAVPAATAQPGTVGRLVCDWRFEHDLATRIPVRPSLRGTWQQPRAQASQEWRAPGEHTVVCDVRFEPDPYAPAATRDAPVPPTGRLELPVRVRSLEALSADRFATQAPGESAYVEARLAPLVQREQARTAATREAPDVVQRREHRIADMETIAARIDPARRISARAQLTLRTSARSQPLAIVIGHVATRGQGSAQPALMLADFTAGVRRMEYGTAATSTELVDLLERHNSYAPGLVEIEIPANAHGIAPLRRSFRTTGRSETGTAADALGHVATTAGVAGFAAGGVTPVSVALYVVAGVAGAASAGLSLIERARDARPDARAVTLDVLGVASSMLGLGAMAAFGRTVTVAGRTMHVANVASGLALGADAGSLVLVSVESVTQLRRVWNNPAVPERERLAALAQAIASIATQGGMLVLATARHVQATRETPQAPQAPQAEPPPHTPQEVLARMQETRANALRGHRDGDPSWRQTVGPDTDFVRVVGPGEVASLVHRGQVVNHNVRETIQRDPLEAHRSYVTGTPDPDDPVLGRLFRPDDAGRPRLRGEFERTNAGSADPVFPVSAHGPAGGGYAASLTDPRRTGAHRRFLVRFRDGTRTMVSGNHSHQETEYFIPMQYRLGDVAWIADVQNNTWLYGAPGRAGTAAEAEALRALFAAPAPAARPAPIATPIEEGRLHVRLREIGATIGRVRDPQLAERYRMVRLEMQQDLSRLANLRRAGRTDDAVAQEIYGRLDAILSELAQRAAPR